MNAASVRLRRLYRPTVAPQAPSGIALGNGSELATAGLGEAFPKFTCPPSGIPCLTPNTEDKRGDKSSPCPWPLAVLSSGFLSSFSFSKVFGKAAGRVRPEAQPRGAGCNRAARRACPHPCGVGSRLCTAGGRAHHLCAWEDVDRNPGEQGPKLGQ